MSRYPLALCAFFIALGAHSGEPGRVWAAAPTLHAFKRIEIDGGRPTSITLENGVTISLYGLVERKGQIGSAGFLIKYFVVYSKPTSIPAWNSSMVALISDHSLTDHFESSNSGGDCEDQDTEFFYNGQKIVAVSLTRQNKNQQSPKPGDASGTAYFQLYTLQKNPNPFPEDTAYGAYYFSLVQEGKLADVAYCTYKDVQNSVSEELRKYGEQ